MDLFEDELNKVDSDNFDAKLQAYYSNKKSSNDISQHIQSPLLFGSENLSLFIEDHCADTIALREANNSMRRRITDLDSEMIELKVKKDIENPKSPFETGHNGSPVSTTSTSNGSVSQIDENRRRERQAQLAIAEHDANLIRRLETELIRLETQHEVDVKLVSDNAERISNLLLDNEEKDLRLVYNDAATLRLDAQIKHLSDQLKSHESLLENERLLLVNEKNNHKITMDASRSRILASGGSISQSLKRQEGNKSQSHSLASTSHATSHESTPRSERRYNASTASAEHKQIHNASNHKDKQLMSNFRTSNSFPGPLKLFPKDSEENEKNLHPDHLRIENAVLLEELESVRDLVRRQENALNQVRTSAEEITLLEAEEIARLETELESCRSEKDDWRQRCKSAEIQVKHLLKQQMQLEELMNMDVDGSCNNSKMPAPLNRVLDKDLEDTVYVDIGGGRRAYQPGYESH
jgi:hypothetical protein